MADQLGLFRAGLFDDSQLDELGVVEVTEDGMFLDAPHLGRIGISWRSLAEILKQRIVQELLAQTEDEL